MDYLAQYKEKYCTPEEAVQLVRDGDWIDYTQGITFPYALDKALAERCGELHDIKVRGNMGLRRLAILEKDPDGNTFTYQTWHATAVERHYIDQGRAFYSPMLFRNCGSYYQKGKAPVDVVMVSVSPMDKDGNFSFGCNPCCTRDTINAARYVLAEENKNLPHVSGMSDDHIHISEVDRIVRCDEPVPSMNNPLPSDLDKKIAVQIFPYLTDGMTLQLGVGGIPNALGHLIADSDLKDLGMHTEFMSDGYLSLYQSGRMTNQKKELQRGKGVFSTCAGSLSLYNYIDHNLNVMSAPIAYVNDPAVIRQFDRFTSINGCLAVDLYGQIASESAGTRHISGTGGQVDFVTGAWLSALGKAFITLRSVHTDSHGIMHSTIIPDFTQGDIITTPRSQAPYIATEYGVAELSGKSTWERAEALIHIAHPDFRESLIQAAEAQHIWRRSSRR